MSNELGCGGDVDCQKALDELYAYVDGWSQGEERGSIKQHLEACAPCLDVYGFHESLQHLISSTCQSELPETLRLRVLEAIASCEDDPSVDA